MASPFSLAYTDIGHGQPILLLHGLGGSRQQWAGIIPADWPCRQWIPDLPGHGQTDWLPAGGCTFGTFADALQQTFQPTEPMLVAGISMGAGIALRLALQAPALVGKLLLVRPAWLDQPNPPNLAILARLGAYWRNHSTEQTHNWLLNDDSFRDLQQASPACAASVEAQLKRPHPALAARTLVDMTAQVPIESPSDWQRIRVPVRVIGSERDPLHPFALAKTLADRLPNAHFHEVASRYEQPDEHLYQLRQQLHDFVSGR